MNKLAERIWDQTSRREEHKQLYEVFRNMLNSKLQNIWYLNTVINKMVQLQIVKGEGSIPPKIKMLMQGRIKKRKNHAKC